MRRRGARQRPGAAIKRGLRRGKRVVVKLELTVADALNNARVLTRDVRIRR